MGLPASYVLPLCSADDTGSDEMTAYLEWLSAAIDEVIVVDGSPPELFERHASSWGPLVKHLRPDADLDFVNRKVNGVVTGVRAAGHERVVVADDDIRYEQGSLSRVNDLLARHDLVVVQSYFDPVPWNAVWDTSRILLNRAAGVHFPATLGLRRDLFLAAGAYDGDVLFENLELMRTLEVAGASIARPPGLFVRHLPPTSEHFWSQRVRQAYDDFALPPRMALWLALGPWLARSFLRGRVGRVAGAALGAVALAELGRRRGGGTAFYPARASWCAPLWLAERAACAWVALWYRWRKGGVPYRGLPIRRAATPRSGLRARIGGRLWGTPPGR